MAWPWRNRGMPTACIFNFPTDLWLECVATRCTVTAVHTSQKDATAYGIDMSRTANTHQINCTNLRLASVSPSI